MKKRLTENRIIQFLNKRYYVAPHIWYSILDVLISVIVWGSLCIGHFQWQVNDIRSADEVLFERVHECLLNVEEKCSEQMQNVYKDSRLVDDFWLFWNNTIDNYMEQRISSSYLSENAAGDTKSFPEYMNVFITEHEDIFSKIYFATAVDIYALSINERGGGGFYSYGIPYSRFIEETQSDPAGYPIVINIQDSTGGKDSRGRIVFLVNDDYLFRDLEASYDDYVVFHYGNASKFWGDVSKRKENTGFWNYSTVYECEQHGIRFEHGFNGYFVLKKGRLIFLSITTAIFTIMGMMHVWIRRMNKSNEKFLEAFIHTIQLAKVGDFHQVEVREGRRDNYARLAREINDMIENLDILIKKEYLLKISQQKTEMEAMLYQINPHFLYNTLEIIRTQANMQGNFRVSDALYDLGSMYRMLSKLSDTISMKQEIELLTHYLNILELKAQENFYYEIDMDDELMELETVKFWMQPLAENYFVHGYDRTKEYNLFSVQGQKKDNIYQILIMDNGSGMEEEEIRRLNQELENQKGGLPRENIGIRNVSQRLKYFYQNKISFQIKKNKPKGICFEICIEQDWKRS